MRTIMNLREICDWRMVPTGLLCLACALPESTLSPPCNLLEQDPELRPGPRSFFYLASGPTQFLQLCVRAHAVSSTLRPGPRSFFNFASGPKVASTQRRNFLRVTLLLNVRPTNTQRILHQIFLLSNLRPKMEEKPRTLKKRKLLARSWERNNKNNGKYLIDHPTHEDEGEQNRSYITSTGWWFKS